MVPEKISRDAEVKDRLVRLIRAALSALQMFDAGLLAECDAKEAYGIEDNEMLLDNFKVIELRK